MVQNLAGLQSFKVSNREAKRTQHTIHPRSFRHNTGFGLNRPRKTKNQGRMPLPKVHLVEQISPAGNIGAVLSEWIHLWEGAELLPGTQVCQWCNHSIPSVGKLLGIGPEALHSLAHSKSSSSQRVSQAVSGRSALRLDQSIWLDCCPCQNIAKVWHRLNPTASIAPQPLSITQTLLKAACQVTPTTCLPAQQHEMCSDKYSCAGRAWPVEHCVSCAVCLPVNVS